jgi:thiol:disulfide interchange protein DsbC
MAKRFGLTTLLLSAALAPCAAQEPSDTPAELAARLKALYPSTRFGQVGPTPWPGVFEVVLGNQLAYVDASGQYFLFGHLYDMKQQRDITAERKDLLARIDFASLPLADALKEVRGSGARMFAIFSDPDCPYCRKLEAEVQELTDVTIYTFLMPVSSLHPDARAKAIAVWCAADPIAAWRALMVRSETPVAQDCPHPVDRNVALADRLGISATPTLIAQDGRVLAGAAGRGQIEAWLSRKASEAAR